MLQKTKITKHKDNLCPSSRESNEWGTDLFKCKRAQNKN